jgi:hypothetical protein
MCLHVWNLREISSVVPVRAMYKCTCTDLQCGTPGILTDIGTKSPQEKLYLRSLYRSDNLYVLPAFSPTSERNVRKKNSTYVYCKLNLCDCVYSTHCVYRCCLAALIVLVASSWADVLHSWYFLLRLGHVMSMHPF